MKGKLSDLTSDMAEAIAREAVEQRVKDKEEADAIICAQEIAPGSFHMVNRASTTW
jgi:hypothetical protein